MREQDALAHGADKSLFYYGDWIKKPGVANSRHIDFQPITDLAESVVENVRKTRENPLVPKYIPIYGYICDVKTGALVEVPAATQIGKAQ